ncbi:hypothetical protein BH09MYX1_BH09MYX1_56400 [soil metagenome]
MRKSLSFIFLGTAAASVAIFVACSSDKTNPNPNPTVTECVATAGGYPDPKCDPSTNTCLGSATDCKIGNTATCGDIATCKPLADNTGKTTVDLRLRRLLVVSPSSLAGATIQENVVTKGIDLNSPACGEKGDGAFNWLVRLDKTAGSLVTGGAPPTTDVMGKGYCFFHQTIGGIEVKSETIKTTVTGDTFSTDPISLLNVPIFVGGDVNNVVILPIRKAVLKSATLSNGGNCVGSFNPKALDDTCGVRDRDTCQPWKTDGAIGGYITLEDADKVNVDLIKASLCVILTGTPKGPDTKCTRTNGKINGEGDFCSTTESPGGCKDSFWLSATFAASAVKINDGTGDPNCQGGTPPPSDGGTDGSSSDSGSDAGVGDAKVD